VEIKLKGIRIRTVILGSKLHAVPQIKFIADLIEHIVTAAIEDQKWQDAYNAAQDSNPSTNIEYLHRAYYYKERL
jgi:hypothetical protein